MSFRIIFSYLIGIVLLVSCINYTVDPHRWFMGNKPADRNDIKPFIQKKLIESKVLTSDILEFDTLFVGTSTVEIGIDPSLYPLEVGTAYNFAIPKSSVAHLTEYVGYVSGRRKLKKVFVGLDFVQFNKFGIANPLYRQGFIDAASSRHFRPLLLGAYKLQELASTHSMIDSLNTLRSHTRNKMKSNRMWNGLRSLEGEFGIRARAESYHKKFKRVERAFVTYLYDRNYSSPFFLQRYQDPENGYDEIIKLIHLSQKHGFELIFFTNPPHARHLQLILELNLWCDFVEWKRRVVNIINSESERYKLDIRFWDFAFTNELTSEALPSEVGKEMKYYVESTHYLPSLGKEIVNVMISDKDSDFGRLLTPKNLESVLASDLSRQIKWAKEFPRDHTEVRNSSKLSKYVNKRECSLYENAMRNGLLVH